MRGHIRKREGKRGTTYSVVVDVGHETDEKGVRRRKQAWHGRYATKKEAQKALAEIVTRLDKGTYVEPTRQTVGEFVDEWLKVVSPRLRPSTWTSYSDIASWYIKPRIGHVALQELSAGTLNALYADLLSEGRKKGEGGLSARTVRYVHIVIRRSLKDAVKWNRLTRNVADSADPPKVSRSKDMRVWTAEQLRAFLDSLTGDRLYAAWVLASTTGMRRGEVLGLRWVDVDLDALTVSVSQSRVSVNYEASFSAPKTDRSRRSIPIDERTASVLKAHRKQQLEERMAWGPAYAETDLVFTREDGAPIHPDRFTKVFNAHVKRSGLPRIRVHDLRHTYATLALRAGVHPKVVQERLGHTSIAITLDTYSHAIPAMQEEAADRVAGLIFGTG